jgi:hypothetical protein
MLDIGFYLHDIDSSIILLSFSIVAKYEQLCSSYYYLLIKIVTDVIVIVLS